MKKFFQRWYEKDEYLRAFMNLMADLDTDIQCEIAIDIIMVTADMLERDYKKIIQEIGSYNPADYNRWYDKNPNIHLAIESLKDLNSTQRDAVVKEFSDRILNHHYIKIDEDVDINDLIDEDTNFFGNNPYA